MQAEWPTLLSPPARMFRALVGKRASQAAQRRLIQLVVELTREDLGLLLSPSRLEAAVHYIAGALVEANTWAAGSRGVAC
jgi:hypothetical protein